MEGHNGKKRWLKTALLFFNQGDYVWNIELDQMKFIEAFLQIILRFKEKKSQN
jgi:hypothetical protein